MIKLRGVWKYPIAVFVAAAVCGQGGCGDPARSETGGTGGHGTDGGMPEHDGDNATAGAGGKPSAGYGGEPSGGTEEAGVGLAGSSNGGAGSVGTSVGNGGAGGSAAFADAASDVTSNHGGQGGQGTSMRGPFRVVGYVTSWSGEVGAIPFSRLTHVNYAFALPTPEGTLRPVDNEAKLDQLVTSARAAGVRVSLSIGGWNDGDDSAFHALAKAEATRVAFVDTLCAYIEAHQLDGADLDWEYPEADAREGFTDLAARLAARLHPAGKLVTAAVSGSSWGTGGITADAFPHFDFITLMAYDGGEGAKHSPLSYATSALDFWLGTKKLPAAKAVLGVPFYAVPNSKPYAEIVASDPTAAQRDETNGDFYNGIPTIEAKTTLALQRASGVMIWELSQDARDDKSLLAAIDRVVKAQ